MVARIRLSSVAAVTVAVARFAVAAGGAGAAVAAVMLAAVPVAEAALDCRRATPFPDDLAVMAPAAGVPESAARFSGAWNGAWLDARGNDDRCHTLVVEEVLAPGYVRVVYSVGASPTVGTGIPNVWRVSGRIVDGVLRFRLPTFSRPALAYRFDGARLSGTFDGGGVVKLDRIADVAPMRCGPASPAIPDPPAAGPRDRLTAAELMARARTDIRPLPNAYFMPVGPAEPAKHAFRGTLAIAASSLAGENQGCAAVPQATQAFSATFVSHGDHLVPAVRGFAPPAGPVILSPGRVWSEPEDAGLSRASFPFTVVNPVDNAAHNGLATFLFDDTRVSALRVQIVQETAPWARLDRWGQVPMTYAPGPVANETALRAEFADEVRRQTPIRPWSDLPPSPALAAFDGDAAPLDISANGLIVDGVLYVRGCHTRHGPYPYCREMRHGAFSVTKSAGAAVALFRLAQKYGDAVMTEKLVDHLPPGLAHTGWSAVTFADALNMATGIGDEGRERDGNISADENRPKLVNWVVRRKTAHEKLAGALDYSQYPWGAGEVLRYNSAQTFVLAAALDAYLKRREGPDARLWDMVVNEVYRPIGIAHGPAMHTVETDGSPGLPILAYGLYLTVDDVAKVTTLLQNGGRHDGVQLLSATKLAEALYRTSPEVGLPTRGRNRFGDGRYHLSFWSVPYRTSTGCFVQIPYMAGFGGNLVALLPNGVSVFRFADADHFDLDAMILAGESIRPFCPPRATANAAPARTPLTASELSTEILGHTLAFGTQRVVYTTDGRLFGAAPDDVDLGTWKITEDGRLCRTWIKWDRGLPRCFAVYRDGESYAFEVPERFSRAVARRTPGGLDP